MLTQDAEAQLGFGVWPPEAGQAYGSACCWVGEEKVKGEPSKQGFGGQ